MSDLATDSLGHTEGNKLTLSERRKNYETWLASNKRIPMGNGHARTDEKPALQALADKRAKAAEDAASTLLNPLSPGAVCRTDEGNENASPSDDVRLGLAKILLSKAEGSNPAQAERIANATSALLGPITRTDDDADLKNRVTPGAPPVKRGTSPGAETAKDGDEDEPDKAKARKVKEDDDEDEEEDKQPTLREVMDALGNLGKRLDAIEKKDDDDADGSEAEHTSGAPLEGKGTPKSLAANSAAIANNKKAKLWRAKMDQIGEVLCRPDTADLFTTFQARADRAYSIWGLRAEAPLHGEKLINYRRRLLYPLQKHSQAFKLADLRVTAVDAASFKAAEDSIYESAIAAGTRNDNVPTGYLREVTENRGGHQYTKFYGNPKAWMNQFAPRGKRVKRVDQQNENGVPVKSLYTSTY